MIREALARRFPELRAARPVHRAPRKGDLPFSRADTAKAERLLGYAPAVRIMAGLERTIDWYAENLPGAREARKVVHA